MRRKLLIITTTLILLFCIAAPAYAYDLPYSGTYEYRASSEIDNPSTSDIEAYPGMDIPVRVTSTVTYTGLIPLYSPAITIEAEGTLEKNGRAVDQQEDNFEIESRWIKPQKTYSETQTFVYELPAALAPGRYALKCVAYIEIPTLSKSKYSCDFTIDVQDPRQPVPVQSSPPTVVPTQSMIPPAITSTAVPPISRATYYVSATLPATPTPQAAPASIDEQVLQPPENAVTTSPLPTLLIAVFILGLTLGLIASLFHFRGLIRPTGRMVTIGIIAILGLSIFTLAAVLSVTSGMSVLGTNAAEENKVFTPIASPTPVPTQTPAPAVTANPDSPQERLKPFIGTWSIDTGRSTHTIDIYPDGAFRHRIAANGKITSYAGKVSYLRGPDFTLTLKSNEDEYLAGVGLADNRLAWSALSTDTCERVGQMRFSLEKEL